MATIAASAYVLLSLSRPRPAYAKIEIKIISRRKTAAHKPPNITSTFFKESDYQLSACSGRGWSLREFERSRFDTIVRAQHNLGREPLLERLEVFCAVVI